MVLPAPIDWSALYSTMYAWAFGATGITTRWADQNAPRPNYPYLLLDVTSGPTKEGGIDETSTSTDLTRARDTKVTPVAQNNTTYTITINSTPFAYLSDADATVAEITAGLASAINGGSEPVSATDNGTDLDIVGDPETLNPSVSGLFNITLTDDFDGSQMTRENNDGGNEVEIRVVGSREFTLNVQAFERNTNDDNPGSDPSRNANNYLTILQSSLGLPSVQQQLRDGNIALIQELPVVDLSSTVEDIVESRASMDIRMRTFSQYVEYTGFIQDVTGTGSISVPDGTINAPLSVNT